MDNNNKQFDFSRNDNFYELTIPSYTHVGESVFYEIHLRDLIKGTHYTCLFRFNDLKAIHEGLSKSNTQLPEFPKTHLWKKTNKNPKMIEERRVMLAKYFHEIVNNPFIRGSSDVKVFLRTCKLGKDRQKTFSLKKKSERSVTTSRPKSLTKSNVSLQNINFRPNKK